MDLDSIRDKVWRAIAPLVPASLDVPTERSIIISGVRTSARLPAYYIVYFVLVDLLGFKDGGRWEKTAWSVAAEYEDTPLLIEHRKFGLGIFGADDAATEEIAAKAAICLHRAAKAAQPYLDWRAQQAARESHLNVVNRSQELFGRLEFLLGQYDAKAAEAEARRDECIATELGPNAWSHSYPRYQLRREARWLALTAIESFFSWTEHVFIHIAILRGLCATGEQVAALAKADWVEKYKAALGLGDADDKRFYDDLVVMRRQLRNFVAHGSFGKEGEALEFHSAVGAVPMLLPHRRDRSSFRFGAGVDLRAEPSIALIRDFITHLWTGTRSPARIYIQEWEHPLILTHVQDGTYADAMRSDEDMEAYASHLGELMDRHANMDF